MDAPFRHEGLIAPGERCARTVRFSREQIAEFARLSGDDNPLHLDDLVAQRARFGEIVASGQQTAAALMGLVSSHFSQPLAGGRRQVICLNFNFAFKRPVFADQDLLLQWRVGSVEWSSRLDGAIGHLDGTAGVKGSAPSVVGRGTILVQRRVG
jgi:acyl dehydratase